MRTTFTRIAGSALLAATMAVTAACGTISRSPDGVVRVVDASLAPAHDPRVRASDTEALTALVNDMTARFDATDPSAILALSGGGANGAFGAGVLVGWTEAGDRPRFGIVTGVSTGALAAPFAFLGPEWDDELEAAYTDGETQGLLSWRSFAAFFAPSLFSPADLRKVVEAHVTPQLLTEIAREHSKGRRLLVATTDLDAQETVIWDMGVLAEQGALTLFQDVLVASASIPGVFPPVLIAGMNDQGQVVESMHVDGGVNTPFLGVPEALMTWTPANPGVTRGPFYVLVNGQVMRDPVVTPGRLRDIVARSYDSMSKASLRVQLTATAVFADRVGLPLFVAAIPAGVQASSLDFDPESMRALFELGRREARRHRAWTRFDADYLATLADGRVTTPEVSPPEPAAEAPRQP